MKKLILVILLLGSSLANATEIKFFAIENSETHAIEFESGYISVGTEYVSLKFQDWTWDYHRILRVQEKNNRWVFFLYSVTYSRYATLIICKYQPRAYYVTDEIEFTFYLRQ